jgi:hypothetical protein
MSADFHIHKLTRRKSSINWFTILSENKKICITDFLAGEQIF